MKLTLVEFLLLLTSDLAVGSILVFLYTKFHIVHSREVLIFMGIILVLVVLRAFFFFLSRWFFYRRRINIIKDVVAGFKKGKFVRPDVRSRFDGELDGILKELIVAGRHLDSLVSSQKKEIDSFHELYNSIIFSISSYFIVLNDDDRVLFANDGFCEKFQIQREDLYDRRIEDVFYFVNARLKGGIERVRKSGVTEVLEKTHLLTLNKVSVIADIKISDIVVQNARQIIIVIDDVTKKLRNDYQISLMSQITESIRKDDEIDRVLFTILTGVTSGSGLGFNRAMLFLVEEGALTGKMAVGPDSFDEAIEIWNAASGESEGHFRDVQSVEMKAGVELLNLAFDARLRRIFDEDVGAQQDVAV